MRSPYKATVSLLSIMFIITTLSISHGANKKISGDDKNLQNLEKEYPKLVEPWREAKDMVVDIRKSEYIFGVPDRAIAEKKKKKTLTAYKSVKIKFNSQFATCKKQITGKLNKSEKKLSSLEKKKKLTPAMQSRKAELEEEVSQLRGMLNTAEDMNHPFPASRPTDEIQRLKIEAGEVARKQVIAYAPKLIVYRMALQDNIVDIEKLQKKGKDKLTSADKQKLKKSLQQLKMNYKKVATAAESKKKTLTTELAKLEKKMVYIKAKTEKAEKAKRNTDKLDHERLSLIGEISTLNYQLDLIDKMVDVEKANNILAEINK